MKRSVRVILGGVLAAAVATAALAQQADATSGWVALASDRLASGVGDALIVLISESATASGTTVNSLNKKTTGAGSLTTGESHSAARGSLSVASSYDGSGQSGRSDRMVASISVTVVGVAPNGDLLVAGEEGLNVNGERTHISVRGRARRVDISNANTILSTRLADAQIDYTGAGLIGRGARPGLLSRVLSGFGLF